MEQWPQAAPWHAGGRIRARVLELDSLTTLRFVAALLVFLRHEQALTRFWPSWAFPFDIGFVGVSFFFVLSGFVLAWTSRPEDTRVGFYRRRFARVYPAHAATWLIAFWIISFTGQEFSWWAAAASLLLVQAWVPMQSVFFGMNGVSWSLSCEAMFYAVFPPIHARLARWSPRRRWTVALAAVGACQAGGVAVSVLVGGDADLAAYVNPAFRLGEFILGMALGIEMAHGWLPALRARGALLAGTGVVLLTMQVWRIEAPDVRYGLLDAMMLVPFTLVIVCAAARDIEGRPSLLRSAIGVYLGRLSYPFYLTHVMVMLVTMELYGLPETLGGAFQRIGIDLAGALAAAAILHHAVEVPARRLLLARRSRRLRVAEPVPVPAPVQVGTARAPA